MPALLQTVTTVSDEYDSDTLGVNIHSVVSSISSEAAKSTYYFPVMVSKNVDPESCYLIADYLDYMYAYFMRACFSQTPAIKVSGDINVEDYLKRFHQNSNTRGDEYAIGVKLPKRLLSNIVSKATGNLIDGDVLGFLPEAADPMSEFEYLSNKPLNEATFRERSAKASKDLAIAYKETKQAEKEEAIRNSYDAQARYYKAQAATEKSAKELHEQELRRNKAIDYEDAKAAKAKAAAEEHNSRAAEYNADRAKLSAEQAADEARERNEKRYAEELEANVARWSAEKVEQRNSSAQPLVIPVTCTFMSGIHEIPVNVPIGIKTVIHDCDPYELRDVIKDSMTGKGFIKGFVRWKTGELDSLADVIFGIKEMRRAVSGTSELKRWQEVVLKRKLINKMSMAASAKKPFLANTAVIISIDDAHEIERLTKIDVIKDIKYAYRMMKDNMLLAFIIADEVNEKAYILYDGRTGFESVPYKAIERDIKKDSKMIENLIKVMALR